MSAHARWHHMVLIVFIPVFVVFFWLAQDVPFRLRQPSLLSTTHSYAPIDTRITDLLKELWKPLMHPITNRTFTPYNGEVLYVNGSLIHKKPLGKKMLVLDSDTRALNETGYPFADSPQSWEDFKPLSAGMLGHYLYAQLHGYDYKFVRAPSYQDRYSTWTKVAMIHEALKSSQYTHVLFMDSDVSPTHFHLPLEWSLNYWSIGPKTLIAMARDPDEPWNHDLRTGQVYLNSGFMIVQRSPRTLEMLKRWSECPIELEGRKEDKGCGKWKTEPFHEQAAFGNYVRYEFDGEEEVKALSCSEANGCPEAEGRGEGGCVGVLWRHFWQDKSLPLKQFGSTIMGAIVPLLHEQFLNNQRNFAPDLRDKVLSGAEVIG